MEANRKQAAVESIAHGQAVIIRTFSTSGRLLDEYSGVFLGYWRNGRYWVREDQHGTTSTYYADEIHRAGKEPA